MLTPPIPVVLPLVAAALLASVHRIVPRWLAALIAVFTALVVACVAVSMVVYARDAALVVYWLGSASTHVGPVEGLAFVIEDSSAIWCCSPASSAQWR